MQTPVGVIIAANVVWQIVAWGAGIIDYALNQVAYYVISGVIFMADIAVAYFLLDRLTYFFAQFVLPIQNPKYRDEIYNRVRDFETDGKRGPALFIKNGRVIANEEELEKKGPGLIVVDTASAAVLRTDTELRDTVGPGVKFTKDKEYIEGSVDLRQQWQYIGPEGGGEKTEGTTRDEVEIKATISIKFCIRRPKQNKPTESGVISEYGYDAEAVRNAITREFIEVGDDELSLISWEEIPADLVVGIWREYVHKFKLMELFTPVNNRGETGLQVIERMINLRVTKPDVEGMDSIGTPTQDWVPSREFAQLQKHGLEITEVRIHNIQLAQADEDQILAQWRPEWMKSIQQEEKSLNETEALIATVAREEASKRFSSLLAGQFKADNSAPNPFRSLTALIKPLKDFVLEQGAAGNDMETRLRKLNDIWKWLIDHDAEFVRMQEKNQP